MIIELKSLDEIDPSQLAYHANDPLINQYLRNSFPYPYTLDNALSFINFSLEHHTTDFGIVVDGICVGGVGVTFQKDIYIKNCELGYWLGRDYWNRGIMSKVIQMICEYIFQNFTVTKICAEVFRENETSAHILIKNGFQEEGYLKEHAYKDNIFHDVILYGLRRNEYENQKI